MSNCPHCQTAKRYMEDKNIPFRLCNIKTPAGQKEFSKLNLRGVPVVKVGDTMAREYKIYISLVLKLMWLLNTSG
jgi:glutaredoxin